MARGNLAFTDAASFDLGNYPRAVIKTGGQGVFIGGTNADTGVKISGRPDRARKTITLSPVAMDALGSYTGPVRFVMTLNKIEDGGKVYRLVPATPGQTPHAVVNARA